MHWRKTSYDRGEITWIGEIHLRQHSMDQRAQPQWIQRWFHEFFHLGERKGDSHISQWQIGTVSVQHAA